METSTIIAVLTILAGIIAVIKGAFALLRYIVHNIVTPLTINISALQDATKELRVLLESIRGEMQTIEHRLTIVERDVKTAFTLIDKSSGR